MSEFSKILSYSENYNIIGDKEQVLQILLKSDESIITKKQYIAYSSKNLDEYNLDLINKNNILKQNELKDKGNLISDSNLTFIKNKQMGFEYIGLFNIGKIVKIIPNLYKDVVINYEKCVAFSKNIDLLEKNEISKKIKPFLVNINRALPYYINQNRYCYVSFNNDPIEKLLTNDMLNKREYIFLSSPSIIYS